MDGADPTYKYLQVCSWLSLHRLMKHLKKKKKVVAFSTEMVATPDVRSV